MNREMNWETKRDLKERAEKLYVHAVKCQNADDPVGVKQYAQLCYEIYQRIGAETMEDVAPLCVRRSGVLLPNYLHAGVVAEKFKLDNA